MNYVILSTLLWLLSTVNQSQSSREVTLIHRLNDFFGFDHNIFLLEDTVQDHNRHIPINAKSDGHITPQTVYILDYKSSINVTIETHRNELKTLTTETGQNTFVIVIAVELSYNGRNILDAVIGIRQVKPTVKIGIFLEKNISSMESVLEVFKWSWSNKIVNIFCAFYSNVQEGDVESSLFSVFRFDPFEETFLINLTGRTSLHDYFSSDYKIPNYQHHPFPLFGFTSIIFSDFVVNYWQTVTRIFNATMSIAMVSESGYAKERFKVVDEIAGMFTAAETEEMAHIMLYPFRWTKFQLIVPHARPYSNIVAYLQNTTWMVLFGYTFVLIATSSLALTVSGYLQTSKRNSFTQCVVDVVNLLMNDNLAIKYGRLHRADICIIVPLTFTGLIVSNGILSVFKSYLTVPVYQRQIKTMDDLYESELPIIARQPFWANDTVQLLQARTGRTDWEDRVQPTLTQQYMKDLRELNDSVAYSSIDTAFAVCFSAQKRLNLKAFYLLEDQPLGQYYGTIPLNPNYPFLAALNVIHLRLICHGMIKKWETDADEMDTSALARAKTLSIQFESNSDDSAGNQFGGMFTIIWCGWFVGGIVFVCELISNRFKHQFNKLNEKCCFRTR